MEQNKSKSTSWGVKAKKGARITWVLSAPRWGLIQDDAIVRGCSAIKGSKPSTKADPSDDEEEEDKAYSKTNASEDEDEEEEEEEEEEFDMSNKITELRAFTKKHGIKVVGRKKEDVLNAITKWKKQRKLEKEARKAKAAKPQEDEEASEDENAEQDEEEQEERVKTPAKAPARPAKRRSKAGLTERKAEEVEQAAPEAPATPEKEEEAAVSEPVEVEEETPVVEEQAARAEKISEESEQDEGEIDTDLDLDLDKLDSYNLKTLKAYCEEEGLKLPAGARKQDYITAILDHNADILDEDDNHDGAMVEAPKPKSPEPNQVVGAASPVQAEPKQDENDEDLDLDELDRYSIATLKKYCADERIAVAGTTKEAYVKAILDYNDSERSWLEVSRADDESPREETKTSDKEEAKRDGEKKASVECDVEEETEETEVAMWKRKAAKWKQRARELQRFNELQTKSPHHQMRRASGNNKENASPAQVAKTGVRA